MSPDCRAFLRNLPEHLTAHRAGLPVAHAKACAECAAHLQRAVAVAGLLARKPAVPTNLRSPARFAELCERISSDSPVAGLLADRLRPVEVPAEMPWPEIEPVGAVGRELAGPQLAAPSWLWSRVQDEVRGAIAGHRAEQRRRRFRLLVAASLLGVGLAALAPLRGTVAPAEPRIVFARMSLPLASDYSAALVLQSGGR